MTDTSEKIKKLQLEIWLKKTPAERLHQTLVDNEALFLFWKEVKKNNELSGIKKIDEFYPSQGLCLTNLFCFAVA